MTEGVIVSFEMIISNRSSNIEMIEYSIITDSYFGIKIAIPVVIHGLRNKSPVANVVNFIENGSKCMAICQFQISYPMSISKIEPYLVGQFLFCPQFWISFVQ